MKTYILDILNKIKRYSQQLDAQTIICNRSWYLFNDEGIKSLYIFQEDGTVYVTNNGIVENGTWKFITANQSIILSIDNKSYMLKPAFADNNVLALNLDGTETYSFFIDENNRQSFAPKTLTELQSYFYQVQIENDPELRRQKMLEEQRKEEERQRIAREKEIERQRIEKEKEEERQRIAREKEAEKQRKEKIENEERDNYYEQTKDLLKKCNIKTPNIIVGIIIILLIIVSVSLIRSQSYTLVATLLLIGAGFLIIPLCEDYINIEKLENYIKSNNESELINYIKSDKTIQQRIGLDYNDKVLQVFLKH